MLETEETRKDIVSAAKMYCVCHIYKEVKIF